MRSIRYADLLKTFRDAVQVTRAIGLRYLWIDSLCIIQDDQQDWEREAGKMGEVYRNSYVTIVAARAAGDAEGFLSDRTRMQGQGVNCTIDSHGNEIQGLKARRASAHYEALQEPILKRGWVLQEELLSHRALSFCSTEMTWECRETHLCECASFQEFGRLAAHGHDVPRSNARDARASLFDHHPVKVPQYIGTDFWRRYVLKEYSKRRLTKFSDSLPALSAIAERIHHVTGNVYCAGLWKSTLIEDLLWYNATGYSLQSAEYLAPSWSWASIGANNFSFWLRTQGPDEDIVRGYVSTVECTPAGLNMFGNLSHGFVSLKVTVAQAELLIEELPDGSVDATTLKYTIIWDSSLHVEERRKQNKVPGDKFYPDVVPLYPSRALIDGDMKSTFSRRRTQPATQSDTASVRGCVFCLLMKEYSQMHFDDNNKYDGDRLFRIFLVTTPSDVTTHAYERIGLYVDRTSPIEWPEMSEYGLRKDKQITIV
jgi:hypothetical protein